MNENKDMIMYYSDALGAYIKLLTPNINFNVGIYMKKVAWDSLPDIALNEYEYLSDEGSILVWNLDVGDVDHWSSILDG